MIALSDGVIGEVSGQEFAEGGGGRNRLIERILELNRTAAMPFLQQFGDSALEWYLRHLDAVQNPRGRGARWVRPDVSPAAVVRDRRD